MQEMHSTTDLRVSAFYSPQQYDIVIDEIMSDPTPQAGLPGDEWVELKNIAAFPISLKGWTFHSITGQSGPYLVILQPNSFMIMCTTSAVAGLAPFGSVTGVTNFPSLDNDGDLVYMVSETGKTIHAVQYTSAWYQNELKKNGGWSLEMINTKAPCSGSNYWEASNDANGGTPGKKKFGRCN